MYYIAIGCDVIYKILYFYKVVIYIYNAAYYGLVYESLALNKIIH